MISLDIWSGHHQIRVRGSDQEKLASITPRRTKKTFKVMHFGSNNVSVFYTSMIQYLRKEWLLLFTDMKRVISFDTFHVTIICNDKIIIDDILLYSNHVPTLFH